MFILETLPTLVSKGFSAVSSRCITPSQNMLEANHPKWNSNTLLWDLHGAFHQPHAVEEVYVLVDEKQQILKILMHSFANNEPETTGCHLSREIFCASTAHSFKGTTAIGLSSATFLELDTQNWITCFSEVLRISGSHPGQLKWHNHRLVWSLRMLSQLDFGRKMFHFRGCIKLRCHRDIWIEY